MYSYCAQCSGSKSMGPNDSRKRRQYLTADPRVNYIFYVPYIHYTNTVNDEIKKIKNRNDFFIYVD
jgi:hypothetical protein